MADVLIVLSRYQKNMKSDSTMICDIHQQLNNIEVIIFIYLILQNTMPIALLFRVK